MRIAPAHIPDAKEMARRLCDALKKHRVTADRRDPEAEFLSLRQTQEVMARAMGYASWHELASCLKEPHEAVYIDGNDRMLSTFGDRLSGLLGFNYGHGAVYRAISSSGAGFSPRFRRVLEVNDSPWGQIDTAEVIAPGIRSVITGSHGGLMLSEARQQAMPEHLRIEDGGYEEDGEFHLVALAFPDEAEGMGIPLLRALAHVEVIQPRESKCLSDSDKAVVNYLVKCVQQNRRPAVCPTPPDGEPDFLFVPALEEWVETLARVPRSDYEWPMAAPPWHQHWAWHVRDAERYEAWEAYDMTFLQGFENGDV